MSRQHSARSQLGSQGPSLATAAGLLAGCGITLAGVVLNLSPELILWRTLLGSTIVGGVMWALSLGWRAITPVENDD